MKIAVVGAGAVGCFYGGLLAQAGHQLVLIGRVAHVEAIRAHGLLLERDTGRDYIQLDASTEPAAVRGAELVLICVKSADSEAIAAQIAPYLAAEAQILSLQNGVGNAEHLADKLGRPVLATAVYVGSEMAGPGHVRHRGAGSLAIGSGPKSEELAAMFTAAGIPTKVADDIEGVLWAKLIVNCAYNAISAITDSPYGQIIAREEACDFIRNIVAECETVAVACGVKVFAGQTDRILALGASMAGQYSSTAQDMRRGRPTEIDYLNGYVVRQGAAHAIPTPLNQALLALVKIMEDKARVSQ